MQPHSCICFGYYLFNLTKNQNLNFEGLECDIVQESLIATIALDSLYCNYLESLYCNYLDSLYCNYLESLIATIALDSLYKYVSH